MAATSPTEQIAEEIQNSDLLKALIDGKVSPFFGDHNRLIAHIEDVFEDASRIVTRWKNDCLDMADPANTDLDAYARPIIVTAEIIRRYRPLLGFAQLVYEKCIQLAEAGNADLHRGALYANLAITFLQQGRYKAALPWLHAAAKQDEVHYPNVTSIYDSYAFSESGIFGQWLDGYVLPHLPGDVLAFVNQSLKTNYTNKEIKQFLGWLAGRGDLHIVSSLLDYADVEEKNDFHADSVRLSAIRDLATLFEVLIKQIGANHNDAAVVNEFLEPPTLAGLICHMHFTSKLKDRRNNPALNANRAPGLFHNTLLGSDAILDAIDTGIDYCAGKTNSVHDVWHYLNSNTLSPDPIADALAKRFLLAYKLRNTTSHGFAPTDPNMKPHYDEFRLWLLQAVFVLYFWAKHNGYASL